MLFPACCLPAWSLRGADTMSRCLSLVARQHRLAKRCRCPTPTQQHGARHQQAAGDTCSCRTLQVRLRKQATAVAHSKCSFSTRCCMPVLQ
jgi:hypothetical protein